MTGEKVAFQKQGDSDAESARGRSTIDFPYGDMEDAEEVAQAIHENAGTGCSVEQLAGFMGQAARGGGFRLRVTTAKTFGLIDNPRGQVVLSELGRRMIDPTQQRAARVESFMKVPLYNALYNRFKGNVMPPRAAVTREIQTLGVVETQADRARQAFERSAERAGFFAHGRDRLVMPVIQGTPTKEPPKDTPPDKPKGSGGGTGNGNGGGYDPLIQGMLDRLPEAGTDWPVERRAGWLKALAHNLAMIYGESDKSIKIEVS